MPREQFFCSGRGTDDIETPAGAQLGDYQECLYWLGSYQDWHIQKGTFLLLRDKLELVCWRNLLRRT